MLYSKKKMIYDVLKSFATSTAILYGTFIGKTESSARSLKIDLTGRYSLQAQLLGFVKDLT